MSLCEYVCTTQLFTTNKFLPKIRVLLQIWVKVLIWKNWPKFGSIAQIWGYFCCPKHVFSQYIKNNYQLCKFKSLGGFSTVFNISVNNYSFLAKCLHSQTYRRRLAFDPNLGHCPKFEICNCPKFGAMPQNSAIPDCWRFYNKW